MADRFFWEKQVCLLEVIPSYLLDLTYKFIHKNSVNADVKNASIKVEHIAMLECVRDPNMPTTKLTVDVPKTPHKSWKGTWKEKYYAGIIKSFIPKYTVYSVTCYVKSKFTNTFKNEGHKSCSKDRV